MQYVHRTDHRPYILYILTVKMYIYVTFELYSGSIPVKILLCVYIVPRLKMPCSFVLKAMPQVAVRFISIIPSHYYH